ncbi:uncharacterized protein LOC105859360 [Microcebus murinus]|uniref:uncharacterized protein LOC105859360 n=1 Tax=Microcebus murinus TaxID=30608 RepID=UPI00098ACA89|nr:uncharacterized protein LOC105859360 [Microcebus murinus]
MGIGTTEEEKLPASLQFLNDLPNHTKKQQVWFCGAKKGSSKKLPKAKDKNLPDPSPLLVYRPFYKTIVSRELVSPLGFPEHSLASDYRKGIPEQVLGAPAAAPGPPGTLPAAASAHPNWLAGPRARAPLRRRPTQSLVLAGCVEGHPAHRVSTPPLSRRGSGQHRLQASRSLVRNAVSAHPQPPSPGLRKPAAKPESYPPRPRGDDRKGVPGSAAGGPLLAAARAARSSWLLPLRRRLPHRAAEAHDWQKPEEGGAGQAGFLPPGPWRGSGGGRSATRSPGTRQPRADRCARVRIPGDRAERLASRGKLLLLGDWRQMRGGHGAPKLGGRCCEEGCSGTRRPPGRRGGSSADPYLSGRADARPSRASGTGKSPRREGPGKAAGGFRTSLKIILLMQLATWDPANPNSPQKITMDSLRTNYE